MRTIKLNRRFCGALACIVSLMPVCSFAVADDRANKPTYEQFYRESAVSRSVVDKFIQGSGPMKFDPELGYLHRDTVNLLGIDKSAPIDTIQENGARRAFVYTDRKPRINTYGDSFTHGDQVGDAETWQEYLAGHLEEPIRNFGGSGYGVYQTYLRMLREESSDHGAEYLIFYVCCDDSSRSLMRNWYPLIRARGWGDLIFFAARPNLEMDLKTGKFVENKNPLQTRASLYNVTDPQWMADHLRDDLALQLVLYNLNAISNLDKEKITRLAELLDFPFDWNKKGDEFTAQTEALLDKYSSRATIYILDKARSFAQKNRKKLMVVLFDPSRLMPDLVEGRPRYDQELVDYLVREHFDYFDMNLVLLADYKNSRLSFADYMSQYFIGHLNARGNHLFAYSIKGKIVGWVNPKPRPYLPRSEQSEEKEKQKSKGISQ